jgi:hypothetical protein
MSSDLSLFEPSRADHRHGAFTATRAVSAIETLESRRLLSGTPVLVNLEPLNTAESIIPSAVVSRPAIKDFSLVNAKDDSVIRTINDGDTVDLSALGLRRKDVNVRANFASGEEIGSVKYDLSGATTYHHIENKNGYYLFGGKGANVGSNNNRLALGRNVVTATAYSGKKASGEAGIAQTFAFDLVTGDGSGNGSGSGGSNAVGSVAVVELVDTATGRDVQQLTGFGQTVNLGAVSRDTLSIVARTVGPIGSVTFDLNSDTRTIEKAVPYALFGDNSGRLNAGTFSTGLNEITIMPFSGTNGSGTVGPLVRITFTLVN